MSYQICGDQGQSFDCIRDGFLQAEGLPFSQVLTEQQLHQAFADHDGLFGEEKDDIYTPALTLWGFLSQVTAAGVQRSCNAAVERIRSLCLGMGRRAPSPDSGAYCRARFKLPNGALQDLTYQVADALEAAVPADWLWKGRHVKFADGSTLSMPDTKANQAEWPQPTTQQPGLGFPLLRMCALFSRATAAVCGLAMAPYEGKETGEPALLRQLLDQLHDGDILVGDACFCSYFMLALALARGVDVVVHQHQRRLTDFSKGRSLGNQDHVVEWERPDRPKWMDQETYDSLPKTLTVRELRVKVKDGNCRAKSVTIVTTLTDPKVHSKAEVADLYRERWHVELDLRSLKVTMHMEDLRGETPEMVCKEIWVHCLAYNLLQRATAAAALTAESEPRSLSFAGTLQTVTGSLLQASLSTVGELARLAAQKLESIGSHKVGRRPGRSEPRAVKRRPRKQKLLTKPRDVARAELISSSSGS